MNKELLDIPEFLRNKENLLDEQVKAHNRFRNAVLDEVQNGLHSKSKETGGALYGIDWLEVLDNLRGTDNE